ncbi:MAG: NAD-dependent epimerase/dehydratase family protein [Nitrospira sp.]|nr:NAD-dependent epimerase/dehydratase family protein [Nitrospira sp.]
MNVAIVGGTGFIGKTMATALAAKGHVVTIVTRDQTKAEGEYGCNHH